MPLTRDGSQDWFREGSGMNATSRHPCLNLAQASILPQALSSEGILIANLVSLEERWLQKAEKQPVLRDAARAIADEIDDHIARVRINGRDALYKIPYTGDLLLKERIETGRIACETP